MEVVHWIIAVISGRAVGRYFLWKINRSIEALRCFRFLERQPDPFVVLVEHVGKSATHHFAKAKIAGEHGRFPSIVEFKRVKASGLAERDSCICFFGAFHERAGRTTERQRDLRYTVGELRLLR